jgi:hypothetical protein
MKAFYITAGVVATVIVGGYLVIDSAKVTFQNYRLCEERLTQLGIGITPGRIEEIAEERSRNGNRSVYANIDIISTLQTGKTCEELNTYWDSMGEAARLYLKVHQR